MTLSTITPLFISSVLLLSIMPSIASAQQTCITEIPDLNPTTRYTNHGDGTVTDKDTGLMWKQCLEGVSGINTCTTGTVTTHTWKAALELTADANFAGYSDWRVPNLTELESLVTQNCYNPSINETLFPNDAANSDSVWSSSPVVNNSFDARDVGFIYGGTSSGSRGNSGRVRLVRSGQ